MYYVAYLVEDSNSDYGVSFPDFPGCAATGKTFAEAYGLAAETLSLHIAAMINDGLALPQPKTLAALAEDLARKDVSAFLVYAEPKSF